MTDNDQSKRQEKRDSLFLSATVKLANGDRFTTRVRNLSAGGMMIDSSNELAPGTGVVVELRGIGDVAGRIAWYSPGRAGVSFNREIDPRVARNPVGNAASPMPDYLRTHLSLRNARIR